MSKVKEDQIKQWCLECVEKKKAFGGVGETHRSYKSKETILDPRVIQEKEEISREIEMEQQKLCHRQMKISISIN